MPPSLLFGPTQETPSSSHLNTLNNSPFAPKGIFLNKETPREKLQFAYKAAVPAGSAVFFLPMYCVCFQMSAGLSLPVRICIRWIQTPFSNYGAANALPTFHSFEFFAPPQVVASAGSILSGESSLCLPFWGARTRSVLFLNLYATNHAHKAFICAYVSVWTGLHWKFGDTEVFTSTDRQTTQDSRWCIHVRKTLCLLLTKHPATCLDVSCFPQTWAVQDYLNLN